MDKELSALGIATDPRLRAGIWTFDAWPDGQTDSDDIARRRALALPDYFEVAYLLVRRYLIVADDVAALPGLAST